MMQFRGASQLGKIIVRLDPDIEDIVPIFLQKLNEEVASARLSKVDPMIKTA